MEPEEENVKEAGENMSKGTWRENGKDIRKEKRLLTRMKKRQDEKMERMQK